MGFYSYRMSWFDHIVKFSDNVVENISNVGELKLTNEIIEIDNKSYIKPSLKNMHIHFKYSIIEKEADINGIV